MGSFRFRRSVKVAPGVGLNINKRGVGISAGGRGTRVSVNSKAQRTTSLGIPGTGLSYRTQSGGRRRTSAADEAMLPSPTRLLASLVGWLTILVLVLAVFGGHPDFGGTIAGVGIIVYVLLRVLRGVLDPLLLWLIARRAANNADA